MAYEDYHFEFTHIQIDVIVLHLTLFQGLFSFH